MSALAGVLIVMAMIATAAATGLMLHAFWGTFGQAMRRAPRRRIAAAGAVMVLVYAPGIIALAAAPWGGATDRIVLLIYVGAGVAYMLAFSAVSAARGMRKTRRRSSGDSGTS